MASSNDSVGIQKEAHESDYLLQGQRKNKRGREGLISVVLGLVIVSVLCIGALLSRQKLSHQNSDDIALSGYAATTDSDGSYAVHYSQDIDEKTSFSEMALITLPPWHETSIYALSKLTSDVDPGEVKAIRVCLLNARDFLDVFSPVYSQRSWKRLRQLYKMGYETLGEFQDLQHAKIKYDEELWKKRRQDVLDWKKEFIHYEKTHNVKSFLRHPSKNKCAIRVKSSHLFWSDLDDLPCGNDPAKSSLQKLAAVQLENALNYLEIIMDYKSVLSISRQEYYHNFRKELRSFLGEFNLFAMILVPDASKDDIATLEKAKKLLGGLNDKWTAHHIYAENHEHGTKRKKLEDDIDIQWDNFKEWAEEYDVAGTIQSIIDNLSQVK